MEGNRFLSWTALTLFAAAETIAVLVVFPPTLALFRLLLSEATVWTIGILALLSAILGFIGFRTPQGKIAAMGGVLLLLVVLYLIPTGSSIWN